MDSMLKEIARIQDRYNSAMHSDEAFVNYSDDLINELSAIAKKYPSEFTPLMLLKSIICKSRNQTKHIDILNKMIDMNVNDSLREDLNFCKKQPCDECTKWDNVVYSKMTLHSK